LQAADKAIKYLPQQAPNEESKTIVEVNISMKDIEINKLSQNIILY